MKKSGVILFLTSLVLSCSAGVRNPKNNIGVQSDKRLLKIGLARSFLSAEKRFISYSRRSGRLSIVAPEGPREIWGQTAPGYQEFFTMPEVAGAALWNDKSLYLTEQNASQIFDIRGFQSYGQAATSSLAFTFVNGADSSFKLMKLLADNTWQEEIFQPDWSNRDIANFELITSFSPNGRQLLAFDLFGSAYNVYSADPSRNSMQVSLEGCNTFSSFSADESIRALRWAQDGSRVYLGNQAGMVYQLTPAQGCEPRKLIPQIKLEKPYAVLDIQVDRNQQIYVSQPTVITKVSTAPGSWTVLASMSTSCQLPMGALPLDEDHILIACLVSSAPFDSSQVPLSLPLLDQAQYFIHDIETGEERVLTFQDSSIGGLVIDPEAKRLYMMSSSSLGVLEKYDLITGDKEIMSGILIDGILDQ